MYKIFIGLILLGASAITCSSAPASAPRARHVVIVSIDGWRPDLYLRGRNEKAWPHILSLQDDGAYAVEVEAAYPSLTYPGHASIATGVWPARHGVIANNAFRPPDIEGRGFWYAGDLKAPALWDRARAAGLTVATLSWPCTADSQTIDWNFPEFWTSKRGRESDYMKKFATPSLLEMAEKISGPGWFRRLDVPHQRDELLTRLAIRLIKEQKPNLILLHLVELDKIQHQFGLNTLRVNYCMRRTDRLISDLRKAVEDAGIDEDTAFILVGDHGFADVFYSIAPNTLLATQQLLTRKDKGPLDWIAMAQNTGGSAAIYLKDPKDSETLKKVKNLLLSNSIDLDGNRLYHLIEKDELEKMGGPADAVFGLEAETACMFSGSATGAFFRRAVLKGNHGYDPRKPEMMTGFVAAGSGIRKKKLEHIALVDVAPTVAALLGFDFPDADGRVLQEILY